MTPDHRIKGRAAWNVLDLVVTTLLHVREPADLSQNSASVKAYHNLRNPEATVFVVLFCICICYLFYNQENGSWSIQKVRCSAVQVFYLSLVKNVC